MESVLTLFRDNDFIINAMDKRPTEDEIFFLETQTLCFTSDDYHTHFICVIILEDFVFVTHTFASGFSGKRKLILLMKALYHTLNKRVLVGKDSNHFNRNKVQYNDIVDEIIIKERKWAE